VHAEMSTLIDDEDSPEVVANRLIERMVGIIEEKFGGERIRLPSFRTPESWVDSERERAR
jgi:hypothetical protein